MKLEYIKELGMIVDDLGLIVALVILGAIIIGIPAAALVWIIETIKC